jgi:hypothetical protein
MSGHLEIQMVGDAHPSTCLLFKVGTGEIPFALDASEFELVYRGRVRCQIITGCIMMAPLKVTVATKPPGNSVSKTLFSIATWLHHSYRNAMSKLICAYIKTATLWSAFPVDILIRCSF